MSPYCQNYFVELEGGEVEEGEDTYGWPEIDIPVYIDEMFSDTIISLNITPIPSGVFLIEDSIGKEKAVVNSLEETEAFALSLIKDCAKYFREQLSAEISRAGMIHPVDDIDNLNDCVQEYEIKLHEKVILYINSLWDNKSKSKGLHS